MKTCLLQVNNITLASLLHVSAPTRAIFRQQKNTKMYIKEGDSKKRKRLLSYI
jgi:hypothetical protein